MWSVLAACSAPPEQDPEWIRLGVLIQQQGSVDGPAAVRAARLAAEEVNTQGGVDVGGRRLRVSLLVEDLVDQPKAVIRSTLRLINQQAVVAIVGPNVSRNAVHVARTAYEARVPMVAPGATHPEVTADNPFAFRVTYTDPFQGSELARFVRGELGAADAAVLSDLGNNYSRSLAEVFRSSFVAAGGEVSAYEGFTSEDDEAEALARIQELRPEVLFLPNFNDDVRRQVHIVRRLGMEATLVGGDSWSPSVLAKQPEAEGAYVAAPWHPSAAAEDPRAQAFVEAYAAAWGEDPAFAATAQTYDAVGLLLEAIRRAGRLDPEAIQAALAEIEGYPGVTGDVTFRGTGGDPPSQGVLLQLRGGEARFVKRLSLPVSAHPPGPGGP